MNPSPEQIAIFFREWIPRYNFAITLDDGAGWVDPHTNKRLRRNHVICIMRNDMLAMFPTMEQSLARRLSEKTATRIEDRMLAKIREGQGAYVDVSDAYL